MGRFEGDQQTAEFVWLAKSGDIGRSCSAQSHAKSERLLLLTCAVFESLCNRHERFRLQVRMIQSLKLRQAVERQRRLKKLKDDKDKNEDGNRVSIFPGMILKHDAQNQ